MVVTVENLIDPQYGTGITTFWARDSFILDLFETAFDGECHWLSTDPFVHLT
jgi:hypothetical protein